MIKGAQWPVSLPKMNGVGRTDGLELGAVLGEVDGDDDGELEGLALGARDGDVEGDTLG